MKFFDYIWALLNRPLKKGEEHKKWAKTIGGIFDEAKQSIFEIRRCWYTKTAPKPALKIKGEARGLPMFKGEDTEAYRQRVLNAFDFYVMAGTDKGLIKALNLLGYDNVKLRPLYEVDPERWAEFYIFLDREEMKELDNFNIVKKVVRKYKRASALHNYVFTYYQKLQVKGYYIIGKSTTRAACGTFKGSEKEFYKVVGTVKRKKYFTNPFFIIAYREPISAGQNYKNKIPGYKVTNVYDLNSSFITEINDLFVASTSTKIKQNSYRTIQTLDLTTNKTTKINDLQVCKSQLTAIKNGFKSADNFSLQSGFSYTSNNLMVCSKDTKYTRRVAS